MEILVKYMRLVYRARYHNRHIKCRIRAITSWKFIGSNDNDSIRRSISRLTCNSQDLI